MTRMKMWNNGMEWMFSNHHLTSCGSYMWKQIWEVCKSVLEHVVVLPPQDMYQVLNTHIWWNPDIQVIGFGVSSNQATQLDRNGLGHIRDLWDFENNKPLAAREIVEKFKLDRRELGAIEITMSSIPNQWGALVHQYGRKSPIGSWVWYFDTNLQDAHPAMIFQNNRLKCFCIPINTLYCGYGLT